MNPFTRAFGLFVLSCLAGVVRGQADTVVKVNDFEAGDALKTVSAQYGSTEVKASVAGNSTKSLQWTVQPDNSFASIELSSTPADITPFRILRFKVRSSVP